MAIAAGRNRMADARTEIPRCIFRHPIARKSIAAVERFYIVVHGLNEADRSGLLRSPAFEQAAHRQSVYKIICLVFFIHRIPDNQSAQFRVPRERQRAAVPEREIREAQSNLTRCTRQILQSVKLLPEEWAVLLSEPSAGLCQFR